MSHIKRLAFSSGVLSLLLVSSTIASPAQGNNADSVTDVAAITKPVTAFADEAAAKEKPKSNPDAKDDSKKDEKEPAKAGPFKPTPEQLEAVNKLWVDSWETAKAQSEATGKPILIYFHASWCAYCTHLENLHFPYPESAELLKNEFILVKMDVSNGKSEGTAFYRTFFKGLGTPTLVVADAEKNNIYHRIGITNRDKLLDVLHTGLKKFNAIKEAKAAAEAQAAAPVKTTN